MTQEEKGLERLEEILGKDAGKLVEGFRQVSPDFADYIVNFAYGDLYTRKGLSDKSRELAVVVSLITQGNTGVPLKAHIQGMLNVGWTKNEIIELVIFMISCVGFPSTVSAIKTIHEVFENNEES